MPKCAQSNLQRNNKVFLEVHLESIHPTSNPPPTDGDAMPKIFSTIFYFLRDRIFTSGEDGFHTFAALFRLDALLEASARKFPNNTYLCSQPTVNQGVIDKGPH